MKQNSIFTVSEYTTHVTHQNAAGFNAHKKSERFDDTTRSVRNKVSVSLTYTS